MAITRRDEQRLLTADELEMVEATHHPALSRLSPQELRSLAHRLRERQQRAGDLIRERVRRGKAEGRGAEGQPKLSEKKQVLAAGLRRINTQFARLEQAGRKERNVAKLRQALERRRNRQPHHPQPGRTAGTGMQDNSPPPEHRGVDPRAIGSISQRTRDAQAKSDG